ncbi:reticulon-3 isoform X1 [Echinops telfairi]|uniref:Reticulon-3 isoform X1 n=1 Tax=Echinops telfairi TaxID=9371 RepID=A0AC55DN26_ECHTE|nr:reticulon-3 isoform X1 [Echinops telfairi]
MAEPSAATQSPSVSSSSSGAEPSAPGGGGSPGASPALEGKSCDSSCADSFVSSSSSQPVSLFSTSQDNPTLTTLHGEKASTVGSQPVVAKDVNPTLGNMKEVESPQGTKNNEGAPWTQPSIPASFPQAPAFLPKEVGHKEMNEEQEAKGPAAVPSRDAKSVPVADGKLTLLSAQRAGAGQPEAGGVPPSSLSPPPNDTIEKESPESPFEVILDKAAFDREFQDSYKESLRDSGSWAAPADGESTADLAERKDQLFPLRSKELGRYPTSSLLTRQFSHTTATLEEVSRCVSDMHNFTNEVLTWDLIPQAKQQSDRSDSNKVTTRLEEGEYNSIIPVVNLKANSGQKIPVCSTNGNNPFIKSAGGRADCLDSARDVGIKDVGGNVQQAKDTPLGLPGSSFEKCVSLGSGAATRKVALPSDHPKDEVTWQSSALGEMTEADSSGESDDTVIEDFTADMSSHSCAKTGERDMGEIPSRPRENNPSESSVESISDSELSQAQPNPLGRSPVGKVTPAQVPAVNFSSEAVKQPQNLSDVAPEEPIVTADDETESSPLNVTASAYWEASCGKNVKDLDDSSPEDLLTAFTDSQEKGIVLSAEGNAFEAGSEKKTECRRALPEGLLRQSGSSKVQGTRSDDTDQSEEETKSEPRGCSPLQSTLVASLDLEQEQLTIRALKELGERQAKEPASARGEVESPPEEIAKQTFTFVPDSSFNTLERSTVKAESDLGNSENPALFKDTVRVDSISSLSKTELVDKHVLARLLTDFSVHDLIFWRDVKKTGVVFGTTLIVLLSLAAFSVISVISYLILALLTVTISFRVYKSVIQAVQKSEEGHPFKVYLDVDITLSSEAFHNYVNAAMVHVNKALKLIIRLFLVEDLVDSLKLAVFMWLMTYVGAVFNGITLLILAELLVFSVPVVYEKYKTQIDHYVGIARKQTQAIVDKIQAKLPGIAKKKAEKKAE